MKTIHPGPHPYGERARRRARGHTLVTRVAMTLSLAFALSMMISYASRPGTAPSAVAHSPVR